jgi:hypothetical protein
MIDLLLEERGVTIAALILSFIGPLLLISGSRKIRARAHFALLLSIFTSVSLGIRTMAWGVAGASSIMSPGGMAWPLAYALLGGLAPIFVASIGGGVFALIGLFVGPPRRD